MAPFMTTPLRFYKERDLFVHGAAPLLRRRGIRSAPIRYSTTEPVTSESRQLSKLQCAVTDRAYSLTPFKKQPSSAHLRYRIPTKSGGKQTST
jgi:hypothetical protein